MASLRSTHALLLVTACCWLAVADGFIFTIFFKKFNLDTIGSKPQEIQQPVESWLWTPTPAATLYRSWFPFANLFAPTQPPAVPSQVSKDNIPAVIIGQGYVYQTK